MVWQKGMDLVEAIYRLTKNLPREETYVLSDQMRRAAISVPSNVAEGYARQATRDYARFLAISRGSVFELQTQLLVCKRLGYIEGKEIEDIMELCEQISKMLYALASKL